jgi:hypothetical protein
MPSVTGDNTGADTLSDLPFPLWLVSKQTVNNGMSTAQQTNDVTTYSYKDGFYKWQEREFRGFGTIDESLPSGAKKKYVFHQDDSRKGRPIEVQHRDASSAPFAETESSWSTSQTNGISPVNLTQEKHYTYDSTVDTPKITQTDYQYDSFGNVTKKQSRAIRLCLAMSGLPTMSTPPIRLPGWSTR